MKRIVKIFFVSFFIALALFSGVLVVVRVIWVNDHKLVEEGTLDLEEVEDISENNTESMTEDIDELEEVTLESEPQTLEVEEEIDEDIVLCFVGDICFTDTVSKKLDSNGISGIISDDVQEVLVGADVSMINLEFAFSDRGSPMDDKMYTFRANPLKVSYLNEAGVDIVSLANNHTLDYGIEALEDTLDTLDGAGIKRVGAGRNITEARESSIIEIKGRKIAVLAASRVIPVVEWNATDTRSGLFTTYDPTALIEEIKLAKEMSDYVIVYVHWGIERNTSPEGYQRTMAKQYIDAGADIVVGSHPHVLQGVEYYMGKPIVYSLGNFVFNNTIERTAILKVELNKDNEYQGDISLIPCTASDALTREVSDVDRVRDFYRYIEEISFGVEIDEFGIVR